MVGVRLCKDIWSWGEIELHFWRYEFHGWSEILGVGFQSMSSKLTKTHTDSLTRVNSKLFHFNIKR